MRYETTSIVPLIIPAFRNPMERWLATVPNITTSCTKPVTPAKVKCHGAPRPTHTRNFMPLGIFYDRSTRKLKNSHRPHVEAKPSKDQGTIFFRQPCPHLQDCYDFCFDFWHWTFRLCLHIECIICFKEPKQLVRIWTNAPWRTSKYFLQFKNFKRNWIREEVNHTIQKDNLT